jgi:hypothetical protein
MAICMIGKCPACGANMYNSSPNKCCACGFVLNEKKMPFASSSQFQFLLLLYVAPRQNWKGVVFRATPYASLFCQIIENTEAVK